MTWPAILLLAAASYGLKALGAVLVGERELRPPVRALLDLAPVPLLAALILTQTLSTDGAYAIDARAARAGRRRAARLAARAVPRGRARRRRHGGAAARRGLTGERRRDQRPEDPKPSAPRSSADGGSVSTTRVSGARNGTSSSCAMRSPASPS